MWLLAIPVDSTILGAPLHLALSQVRWLIMGKKVVHHKEPVFEALLKFKLWNLAHGLYPHTAGPLWPEQGPWYLVHVLHCGKKRR